MALPKVVSNTTMFLLRF